jgi:hypothetical protein
MMIVLRGDGEQNYMADCCAGDGCLVHSLVLGQQAIGIIPPQFVRQPAGKVLS